MCEDEASCPRLTAARATAETTQHCSASPRDKTSTLAHDLNTNATASAIPRIAKGTFHPVEPVACAHPQGSFAASLAFRELADFARPGGLTESDVAFCKFCDCSLPSQDRMPRSCSAPRLKVLIVNRSHEHGAERQGACARTAPAGWFGLPFCRARCA